MSGSSSLSRRQGLLYPEVVACDTVALDNISIVFADLSVDCLVTLLVVARVACLDQ